jgi:hypothetical protein
LYDPVVTGAAKNLSKVGVRPCFNIELKDLVEILHDRGFYWAGEP